jgi:hypothetical protein
MMAFWQKLTRATRLLGLLFLALAALNLWQLAAYRPWGRLPLRLSYVDAYGYPVYSDSTEFLAGGQRLTEFDESFRGVTDSSQHSTQPHLLGNWVSDVGVEGRPLRIPTQLRVDYTSLAEGRSYRGLFALPQRRLDSLLAAVRQRPERYRTLYTPGEQRGLELRAGLAPGGVVLVQLLGQQYQAEVARFQARPYPTSWPKMPAYQDTVAYRSLPELRQLMARAERAHLDSVPAVPLGHWDTLRTRYSYCLRVLAPLRARSLHVYYLNGDEEELDPAAQPSCLRQPLPDYLRYAGSAPGFAQSAYSTVFDPGELRRAFSAAAHGGPRRAARAASGAHAGGDTHAGQEPAPNHRADAHDNVRGTGLTRSFFALNC